MDVKKDWVKNVTNLFLLGLCLFLVVIFGSGCGPWVRQQEERRFRASADGSFRYGKIKGFLQIPSGGQPGTTSNKRPALDEVDINTVAIGDTFLTLGYGDHGIYGGARFVRLSGDSVLTDDLISRNVTFPAGTSVDLDARLDWYRFGYQHRFSFRHREHDESTISLTPAIGAVVLNFDYGLDGVGGRSVERAFDKGAPHLGLQAEWSPGGPFSLSGGVHSSLPFSTLPLIFSVELTGRYQIWGESDRGGIAFLGIGYDRIDFEDSQTVPNHIEADMGPLLVVGLKVGF